MNYLLAIIASVAVTAIYLWREKQLLEKSVGHLTDALNPGTWLRRNAQRQKDAQYEFTKTEPKRLGTLPALAKDAEASKGLDRDGNKPLMRNRTGHDSMPSPIGNAAGNSFSGQIEATTTRAIQPKVGREAKREDGAQILPRPKMSLADHNKFPNGRLTPRKINN